MYRRDVAACGPAQAKCLRYLEIGDVRAESMQRLEVSHQSGGIVLIILFSE